MICEFDTVPTATSINAISDPRQPAVLVSEDHEDVLAAIGLLLRSNRFDVEFANSPADALKALRRRTFDAILLDLNYSRDTTCGAEGLDLLSRIQAIDSTVPIVVMTAWGTIELAVDAMHRGASDFVQKPWDNRRLLEVLDQQIERARQLRETRRREERELQEAAQIQRALLPATLAAPKGSTAVAITLPVGNVSGDYYDVIRIDDHRSAICVADVMGKGIGAALLMSNLQATVRMLAVQTSRPDELCHRLNELIALNGAPGRFITFFYCVMDTRNMRLTFTNAGHNWPILAHADGSWERLKTDDTVLGTFSRWNYHQCETSLRSGDRLVLFTDGITECTNPVGQDFGEENLAEDASRHAHLPAQQLQDLILKRVQEHCNGTLLSDDATLLVAAVS